MLPLAPSPKEAELITSFLKCPQHCVYVSILPLYMSAVLEDLQGRWLSVCTIPVRMSIYLAYDAQPVLEFLLLSLCLRIHPLLLL